MSFFQNPFPQEYRGHWVLGDRHHIPTFKCPLNAGRGPTTVVAWNDGPYDLSGNDADGNSADTLVLQFAIDAKFFQWSQLEIDITTQVSDNSDASPHEIVASLANDSQFSSFFTANLDDKNKIQITQKQPETRMKFYIVNGRAEEKLAFNARAGIAELPTYFDRHKVVSLMTAAELDSFTDTSNILIPLDTANMVDSSLIDNAVDAKGKSLGFSSSSVSEDYELLEGRSGLFQFTNVVSGTETIIYSAGAKVGDLAKRIVTNGGNTFELPHTLKSGDLISPP